MNLLQLLLGSLTSDSSVNSLEKKTGIDSKLIKKLAVIAVPLLIRYMTKNAQSQSGAQSLLGALTQHTGNRSMAEQIDEVDEEDGAKIIGHILGNDQDKVVSSLSKETGLSAGDVSKGLGASAPALLTGLSAATTSARQSTSGALDLGSLMNTFGGSQQQATDSLGLLGSLLGGGQQQSSSNDLFGSLLGGLTQQQQPQQQQSSGGLLGSLFGSKEPEPEPQTTGITDLFGSLLGSGTQQQQQSAFDGSDLLNALTSMMNQ